MASSKRETKPILQALEKQLFSLHNQGIFGKKHGPRTVCECPHFVIGRTKAKFDKLQ